MFLLRNVSGLSQDQSGSGVPWGHSIHFTCQCQDFYTVWRIQQHSEPGHSKQHLFFFLAGPAHWLQSSWDISNIGLTWYISFVSHTIQIWKKSFDCYQKFWFSIFIIRNLSFPSKEKIIQYFFINWKCILVSTTFQR